MPEPAKKKSEGQIAAEFPFCVQLTGISVEHFLHLTFVEGVPTAPASSETSSSLRSATDTLVWMDWDLAQYPRKHPQLSCPGHHIEFKIQPGDTVQHGESTHGLCNIIGRHLQRHIYISTSHYLITKGIVAEFFLTGDQVDAEKQLHDQYSVSGERRMGQS